MYVDQHTLEKMGTARLISRYAPDYTDYLGEVFGRPFYLSGPVEIKGTTRLLATFVSDEVASGEDRSPMIKLWVEFNPAMGLYTVWGEYWKSNEASGPLFKSSPRTGFDDELLGDPARVFDWLDPSVSMGEAKSGMSRDEVMALAKEILGNAKLAQMTVDAMFRFPGIKKVSAGWDKKGWTDAIKNNAKNYEGLVDEAKKPKKIGPFSTKMNPERQALAQRLKDDPAVKDPEALALWIGLRMAGKKRSAATEEKESAMEFSKIGSRLEAIRIALEGKMKCESCGCEMGAEEAVEMGDGEMLCEACASEMGEE